MRSKGFLKKYLVMSPFELKNTLIDMAEKRGRRTKTGMLNAGRGNPNFLNTTARHAFCALTSFSIDLASRNCDIADLGMKIEKEGIARKLMAYLRKNRPEGAKFLQSAVRYAEKELKLDPDAFVHELADASLGDFYPSPPRIFPGVEKVVNKYLQAILAGGKRPARGGFDLFATEGATASMVYVFKSLKENFILKKGDHIGILTPIFSPYLEIPALRDYNLREIYVEADEDHGWQVPDSEIAKLKDKRIKALFMVHPTNPTSVCLNKKTLGKMAKIIKNQRKDLIVLTDTVYGTFVDEFHSFVEVVPENTICVYSFSKFFGVTGWRLGVIMLHEGNIIDKKLKRLPASAKKRLDERYSMTSTNPSGIKFIDRLEMDSRDVALAHTGGLSCPQQAQMCLFALFYLLDGKMKYKASIQALLKKRVKLLYDNLGVDLQEGPEHTYYYALIDLGRVAKKKYGADFAKYLTKKFFMDQFLFRLAEGTATVCLPGEGFAGPRWSLRVSLANLETKAYSAVGKNISDTLHQYYVEWKR